VIMIEKNIAYDNLDKDSRKSQGKESGYDSMGTS
jgi:hypothetical protein